jgi:hypothetical protein
MRPQGFGQAAAGLEDLGWNDMGFEPPKPAPAPVRDADHDAFGEELTPPPLRNPLGALTPIQSPVHSQQAEIVERFNPGTDDCVEEELDETAELYEPEAEEAPAPVEAASAPAADLPALAVAVSAPEPAPAPAVAPPRRGSGKPRSAAGSKAKAAFTLRLAPERHLKLRLACALSGRSAQMLVTDALDALLAGMPELDAMAAKANRKG